MGKRWLSFYAVLWGSSWCISRETIRCSKNVPNIPLSWKSGVSHGRQVTTLSLSATRSCYLGSVHAKCNFQQHKEHPPVQHGLVLSWYASSVGQTASQGTQQVKLVLLFPFLFFSLGAYLLTKLRLFQFCLAARRFLLDLYKTSH